MPKVIIYTTPTCVYCKLAKEMFTAHNVLFEEKDVARDAAAREDMIRKTGQMGVPIIEVDNEIVIGFDKERLMELLGIKE